MSHPPRWFVWLVGIAVFVGCQKPPDALEYARRMMEAGNYTAAAQVLQRTVELEPENAEARYQLGVCYLELKRPQDALLTLREALRIRPSARTQVALGKAYHALGQRQRALEQFLAVLQGEDAETWIPEIAGFIGDAHPVRALTHNTVDDYDPAFSPDGKLIAIVSFRVQNAELYLLDLQGRVHSRVTYTDDRNEGSPTFTPDGEWVVCEAASNETREAGLVLQASGSTAQDVDLVAVHVYGRQMQPAFPGNNQGSKPALSPDGRYVAFQSVRDGNLEIYVADRQTGETRRLTNHPADDGTPSFAPDGKTLVFVSSRDGNYELYTIPVEGGTLTRLTHNRWGDYDPVFSPDGRSVVYVSEAGGDKELYRLFLDTGKIEPLTHGVGVSVQPAFSPDGQWLAFVSDRSNFFQIYLMDLTRWPTVEQLQAQILKALQM